MKTLICMAPDGAVVREGTFPSVEAAWDRSQDIGSRWFFYPVHLVTGPAGKSPNARVMDCHPALKEYALGRTLRSVAAMFARNSDAVCAWINGQAPLILEN